MKAKYIYVQLLVGLTTTIRMQRNLCSKLRDLEFSYTHLTWQQVKLVEYLMTP